MNVVEAILSRKSIRAFTDQPVSRSIVEKILDISQRAPSGTNTQPWHTYACTGSTRNAIANDASALFDQGKSQKYEDFNYYPKTWNDTHRDRRRGIGWGLYGLLGIEKGDQTRIMQQAKRNFSFFDAPVALFFTTDTPIIVFVSLFISNIIKLVLNLTSSFILDGLLYTLILSLERLNIDSSSHVLLLKRVTHNIFLLIDKREI